MHILLLHQYYCPPGGWGNNRSYDFARQWVMAGHSVTVVTSAAQFPEGHAAHTQAASTYTLEGVQVHVLNVPYRHAMGYAARVWAFVSFWRKAHALLRKLPKPDLVYACSTPPTVGELGRIYAQKWQVPFVFEVVDVWPDVPIGMGIVKNPLLKWAAHAFVNRLYKQAALVVALSRGKRTQIEHNTRPYLPVVAVYPNGTDTDVFQPLLKTYDSAVKLIYAGTLGPANGVDKLLQALKLLEAKKDFTPFVCEIIGAGKEEARLKAMAEKLKLKSVRFIAPIPKAQMPSVIAQADIGIVTFAPYHILETNSANKFFDYLACGLPVVLNYEGWQAEYLKEYECGLSTPIGYTHIFAEKLAELISNHYLRRHMGKIARSVAVAEFDRKKMALELLVQLQGLIHAK